EVVVGGRGVVVVGVVLASTQVPLMLGFCCSQSFVRLRQCLRCAACVFRQPFSSAFVPVHSLFGGTSARQLLMSCWQSLRQWLAFAATPPASIRTKPSVATAGTARNRFWVIRSKIITVVPVRSGESDRAVPFRHLSRPRGTCVYPVPGGICREART